LETIILNTPAAKSEIYVGRQWESVGNLLPDSGVVIITDDNVLRLYGNKFPDFPIFSVASGEESKRISVIENLASKLLNAGIDRGGFLLGIGGGVVGDITGFLASVYMRGIKFGSVSTTLLAQVDASVGGKNGVNLGETKNIIGTIRQPAFVICDPVMLSSLPDDEYFSGLAELIKTAIIGDRDLFEIITENSDEIINRNVELLSMLIAKAVKFKASVVSQDELETGLRRILNFGHTFGHAIELTQNVKHGFAVASGMELDAWFSFIKGFISEDERDKIIDILKRFKLTTTIPTCEDEIRRLILHDKKKAGDAINYVFSQGIGQTVVEKIGIAEIMEFYRAFVSKKI